MEVVKFADLKDEGQAWASSFCKALNENKDYAEAGKGWKGGLLMVMNPCGEIEEGLSALLDLEDGNCRGIKVLGPGEESETKPIMTATGSMYLWKELAFQEKDPIQCLMSGLLVIEGDMALAMRYARAVMELAKTAEHTDRTLLTKFDLGECPY